MKLINNVQISNEAQKKGYSTSRAIELLEKGAVMVSYILFICFSSLWIVLTPLFLRN